jgi:ComF family protein
MRCLGCALPLHHWGSPAALTSTHTDAPGGQTSARHCQSCRTSPPTLASCHAALDYDYPWDRCITAFKFGDQPGLARVMAHLMWHAPGIAPTLEAADLVVPMPLSNERLRARGYNQAHELARELRRLWRNGRTPTVGQPRYSAHLLHRLRDTRAQSALDAKARKTNLLQAFHVLPADHAQVQGRRVVVVDDIMTTGASLHEAARTLLLAGACHVSGVVLARTPAVS